jgi:hypothetical protein
MIRVVRNERNNILCVMVSKCMLSFQTSDNVSRYSLFQTSDNVSRYSLFQTSDNVFRYSEQLVVNLVHFLLTAHNIIHCINERCFNNCQICYLLILLFLFFLV